LTYVYSSLLRASAFDVLLMRSRWGLKPRLDVTAESGVGSIPNILLRIPSVEWPRSYAWSNVLADLPPWNMCDAQIKTSVPVMS
jgi:hypothetical protein